MNCFHILVYVLFVYVSVYADTFAYYIYNVCIYVANILTLCYPHIFSLAVFNSKACYFISVLYLWFLKFVYYLYISFPRTFYPLVCIFSFVATPFIQFISVQLLSHVRLFATPGTAAHQASLSITISWSSFKLTSIESVMPSSHLILCCPLLLLPPIPPSIRIFSSESTLWMRWPKYWSLSFSISPSKEHPGLISFRMDWLDLLAVQRTLKSLFQHHSSKASVLQCSVFASLIFKYSCFIWFLHIYLNLLLGFIPASYLDVENIMLLLGIFFFLISFFLGKRFLHLCMNFIIYFLSYLNNYLDNFWN